MRFHRKVADLGRTLGHDYARMHPLKVLNVAQDEMRTRLEAAAKVVEDLLTAGWRPSSQTVTQAFEALLVTGSEDKDLFADLFGAVKKAFVDVRREDAEQEAAYVEQLTRTRQHVEDDIHSRLYAVVARLR